MKCDSQYCNKSLEGDFEDILKKGYGYCPIGHRTNLPGDTRFDHECECGAAKLKHPGHSWWCQAYEKRKLPL